MKNQTYTDRINDVKNNEIHLFAAANSTSGFVSFFDKAFCRSGINKIYILKGGPGSGKSTLMKKYGEAAAKKGLTPIYYHCSSDPDSLDGVTVKETGISVLDGTAPHVFDPTYPGVRDFYVDLSPAWNSDILAENSSTIKSLADRKSRCYKTAYRLLNAAGAVSNELYETSRCFVDREKLRSFVKRLVRKYIKAKSGSTASAETVIVSAVSSKGAVRYFTLEKAADTVFFIKSARLAERFLLEELSDAVKMAGVDAVFAVSPENPDSVSAIYLPSVKICISLYDGAMADALRASGKSVKVINASRFINADEYRTVRQKYRFAEKCFDTLMSSALEHLAGAGAFHQKLEEIYISATDYSKVTEIGKAIS